MGSAWHEVSALYRPAARWAGLLALVLAAACGRDREPAPATGAAGVATADTATAPEAPPHAVSDTTGAARSGAGGGAAGGADTAAKLSSADTTTRPSQPAPKPAPAPKPKPAPQPAPEQTAAPAPATAGAPDTAAPSQATAQPRQDTTQAAQGAAPQPLRDAYHQAPRDTVDQATYDGWKQYNLNCARCHGEDVLGTTIAPHLIVSLKPDGPIPTQEAFVQVVCAGRPEKGMPSWCALGMDPAKINQMFAYVKGRSEGKIGPGRPALREGS